MRPALLALVCINLLTGGRLAAQSHQHKGFWLGFGLGAGVNLSEGLDDEKLWGGNGYIRLGGTPNQRVLLGGEAIGWTVDYHDVTLSRGNVHFVALFYPNPRSGLYLKGGIGGASITRSKRSGNTTTTTTKGGFGTGLGLGYEIQIGRNLYLVPATDFLLQVFEKDTDPVLGNIPGSNTLLLFSLGLTWH